MIKDVLKTSANDTNRYKRMQVKGGLTKVILQGNNLKISNSGLKTERQMK